MFLTSWPPEVRKEGTSQGAIIQLECQSETTAGNNPATTAMAKEAVLGRKYPNSRKCRLALLSTLTFYTAARSVKYLFILSRIVCYNGSYHCFIDDVLSRIGVRRVIFRTDLPDPIHGQSTAARPPES